MNIERFLKLWLGILIMCQLYNVIEVPNIPIILVKQHEICTKVKPTSWLHLIIICDDQLQDGLRANITLLMDEGACCKGRAHPNTSNGINLLSTFLKFDSLTNILSPV